MSNNNEIPSVVKSGIFNIFGIDVKCHVLSNGERVIEEESMIKLFDSMGNPDTKIDQKELEQFTRWVKGYKN